MLFSGFLQIPLPPLKDVRFQCCWRETRRLSLLLPLLREERAHITLRPRPQPHEVRSTWLPFGPRSTDVRPFFPPSPSSFCFKRQSGPRTKLPQLSREFLPLSIIDCEDEAEFSPTPFCFSPRAHWLGSISLSLKQR